ncbi:hypothetical protein SO802_020581 [Lithocarpus litseifolius]|uniref:Uncharacterized protein n=1 Tax=Lithocarpus litseifolius TaxID=425828 RepID=A0AAW2CHM7_9ROSI
MLISPHIADCFAHPGQNASAEGGSDVQNHLQLFAQDIAEVKEFLKQKGGASIAWNVPLEFVSVVLLPIVGNAIEHASAIMFAVKDKLLPISVLFGWILGQPMDLNFQLFETAMLFMTVLVVAFMLQE